MLEMKIFDFEIEINQNTSQLSRFRIIVVRYKCYQLHRISGKLKIYLKCLQVSRYSNSGPKPCFNLFYGKYNHMFGYQSEFF